MNSRPERLLFFLLFILTIPIFCMAQISESKAKELIKNTECFGKFVTNVELSRMTRKEDLEDSLLDLQMTFRQQNYGQTFIFEVSGTGNFRISTGKIVSVTSTGRRSLLIAVSEDSGQAYPLYGCPDPEKGFSDLIRQSHIVINTKSVAESFALLRYTFVEDPERGNWIINQLQLRHEAENYFHNWFPSEKAASLYKKWLKKFNKVRSTVRLGVMARKEGGNRFSAFVTYVNRSKQGGFNLMQVNLSVTREGEYEVKQTNKIL